MKVIKNNCDKYPRTETCEHCGSVVEIESYDDIESTDDCVCEYIEHKWRCPCCSHLNSIYFDWK